MLLVGANSSWRPGACSPLCIANRRQETAPTKRYLRISSRLILQSKIKPNLINDGFAFRLGQMNFFVIKVGSKPYISPILFSFCYSSTLKVGKKHLEIE